MAGRQSAQCSVEPEVADTRGAKLWDTSRDGAVNHSDGHVRASSPELHQVKKAHQVKARMDPKPAIVRAS